MGAKNKLQADITYVGWIEDEEKWVSLTGSNIDVVVKRWKEKFSRFLIDFGGFQWWRNDYLASKELVPKNLERAAPVLVTHWHFDHSWRLPLLVKHWWIGKIYMTPITKEITLALLEDSCNIAKVEYEKAQKYNKKVWDTFRTYLACKKLADELNKNNLKAQEKQKILKKLKEHFKKLWLEIKNFGKDVIKRNLEKINQLLEEKWITNESDIKKILKPENPPLYSKDDIKALEPMIVTVPYWEEIILMDNQVVNWEDLDLEKLLEEFKNWFYLKNTFIYPSTKLELDKFFNKYTKAYKKIKEEILNYKSLYEYYLDYLLTQKKNSKILKKFNLVEGEDLEKSIEKVLDTKYWKFYKTTLLSKIKPGDLKEKIKRFEQLKNLVDWCKQANMEIPLQFLKEYEELKSFFDKEWIDYKKDLKKIYSFDLNLEKIYPDDNYIRFFDLILNKDSLNIFKSKFKVLFSNQQDNKFLEKITAKFYDAGHIEGSAQIEITFHLKIKEKNTITGQYEYKKERKAILFSGDLGRIKQPNISGSPEKISSNVKLVSMEGTYSGRLHKDKKTEKEKLSDILQNSKWPVLISVFSLQRLQEVLYDVLENYRWMYEQIKSNLNDTNIKKLLKQLPPVYIDTPLGQKITDIFVKYKPDKYSFLLSSSQEELSKIFNQNINHHALMKIYNSKQKRFVIFSSSWMLNGGFVRDHLKKIVENPSATLVLTGYQWENTLGKKLLDIKEWKEKPEIEIDDKVYKVKCKIIFIWAYSSHADHEDLIQYLKNINFASKAVVSIVHWGKNREKLVEDIKKLNLFPVVPKLGQVLSINL